MLSLRFAAAATLLLLSLIFVDHLAAQKPVDFAHDVLPILQSHCAKCHSNGTYKGSLSLETLKDAVKAGAIEPGKSGDSEMIRRVLSEDEEERMPPEGDRLSKQQISVLKNWIDKGAIWPEELSLKKPAFKAPLKIVKPSPPKSPSGKPHPIDRFVDAYFHDAKTEWPAKLDDEQLLRRMKLDLLGLLPDESELQNFAADKDKDASKREAVADQLLARNEDYAAHWLTFWNDLLRNDYVGTGYIDGGRTQITAWLYRSLVVNKPYDQFVRELVNPQPEAAGFIKGIKWRGRVNASQIQQLQFSQNISQVFLGINMKCASCHDSFIDDWKLEDAYGLAAVISDTPLEIHRCDIPQGKTAESCFVFPELGSIDQNQSREERLKQLSELMTTKENGRFARTIVNRLWQRMIGRGIVHPVDIMANRPWSPELLDWLAAELIEHNYDLKHVMRLIVTSDIYQSESISTDDSNAGESFQFQGVSPKRMIAEQFFDAVWQVTDTAPNKIQAPIGPPADATKDAKQDAKDKPKENVQAKQPRVRASLLQSDPLMRSLGRPNREQVVTTRPEQLSTLQALDLSNGPQLTALIARGADNVIKQNEGASDEELITKIFIRSIARQPTENELAISKELLQSGRTRESVEDLLWTVFMLPEFQLIL